MGGLDSGHVSFVPEVQTNPRDSVLPLLVKGI